MHLSSLGLSEPLLRAVNELGYEAATPVQAGAIPAILRGGDVLASAQTGSGKTAAFVLPMLERLSRGKREVPRRARALVLAPTRELAIQIGKAIGRLGRHIAPPLKTVVAYGGVSINPQMMELRGGADVVVATPGRLLDLFDRNALGLSSVRMLVLDEADRLLDQGFSDEVSRVLGLLPEERQNLLFSATIPASVEALAGELLRDPTRVRVVAATAEEKPAIVQRAIEVDDGRRTLLLRHLLSQHDWPQVLVFVATKHGADHVAAKLAAAGLPAAAFHGELSQGARTAALEGFKAKTVRVLVATDVAARGIDVEKLACVVNYDLPRSAADYLHRIGRTGRAGEPGVAVSFVGAASRAHFRLIEKRHKLSLPREQIAGFEPVDAAPVQQAGGGVKGRRKSKKDKLREAAARGS